MLRKQNGITLIALVVTIIVLLILAAVTITLVLSENGIIKKAEQAQNAQANAVAYDQEITANAAAWLNAYLENVGVQ